MSALRVHGLVAGYGQVTVVRELNLSVDEGEIVALLGPNGAGKTTALTTIAGALPVIRGTITILDRDTAGDSIHKLARLGVALVPQDRGLFHQLTVAENLRLRRPRGRSRSDERIFDYFPALEPLRGRRAGLLSGGEQQMLALACALTSRPHLLMIDEMSLGLAPTIVERLLPVVRRIASESGMAVLLVEQHLHAALQIADRCYVMSHGTVSLSGTADELRDRTDVVEASYMGGAALQ